MQLGKLSKPKTEVVFPRPLVLRSRKTAEGGVELPAAEMAVRALWGLHRRFPFPARGEHRGGRGTAKC